MSGLAALVLPTGVATAELCGDGDAASLRPDERDCARRFSPRRTGQFAAGRTCARRALQSLGRSDCALPIALGGEPAWPHGVVGSITHTDGYCCAAVAERRRFAAVGLDAERIGAVDEDVWPIAFVDAERRALAGLPSAQRARVAAIAFSAKEAFYKAQFPLTRRWLDFTDVAVRIHPEGKFIIEPLVDAAHGVPTALRRGTYASAGGLVLTALALPV